MRSNALMAAGAALLIGTAGASADGGPAPEGPAAYGVYEYHDWAGIYVGAEGGWLWGDDEVLEQFTVTDVVKDGPLDYSTDGYAVGGLIGINMQTGFWVYGGELDVEYADLSGRRDRGGGDLINKKIGVMGSLRARIGFAADRVLIYGTGGLAVGEVDMESVDGPGPVDLIADSQTEFGWTAGGGFEVELWDEWSAGVEYRYTDLGQTEHSGAIFGDLLTYSHSNRFHAVRGRLVYRMQI